MGYLKTITILIVAITLLPAVFFCSSSAGAEEPQSPESTTESNLYETETEVGCTKTLHLSVNLCSFAFQKPGEGYSFRVEFNNEVLTISRNVPVGTNQIPSWPVNESETTLAAGGTLLQIDCIDDRGQFSLRVTPSTVGSTEIHILCTVTVLGITQSQESVYRINAVPKAEYSIRFETPQIDSLGSFHSKGTLKVNGAAVTDLTGFAFYAVGLYRGLSVDNNLVVSGCVDMTDERWYGSDMSFTMVVTSESSESLEMVDCEIRYRLNRDVSGICFNITCGSTVMLDETNPGGSISVFAGTELLLSVENGTCARILCDDVRELAEESVVSDEGSITTHRLNTGGAGSYIVSVGHALEEEKIHVRVNIIAPLVPRNNIIVTCGPLEAEQT